MKRSARAAGKRMLRSAGLEVRRSRPSPPKTGPDPAEAFLALVDLHANPGPTELHDERWTFARYCATHLARSRSQLFQDLFVLHTLGETHRGYFVEFGATDGVALSNTELLEREHGWSGIVAEPARSWHEALVANRSCAIDHRCVWSRSGERLPFDEVADDPEYSTLARFTGSDHHAARRRRSATPYEVETVSLMDLLADHGAPSAIDYLSVDTEGSEFEILKGVDFARYSFAIITVEHNFTTKREQVFDLLTAVGYERRFPAFSAWDDWYVHASERALLL